MMNYIRKHGGMLFNALLLAGIFALARLVSNDHRTVTDMRKDVDVLMGNSGDRYPGERAREDKDEQDTRDDTQDALIYDLHGGIEWLKGRIGGS